MIVPYVGMVLRSDYGWYFEIEKLTGDLFTVSSYDECRRFVERYTCTVNKFTADVNQDNAIKVVECPLTQLLRLID